MKKQDVVVGLSIYSMEKRDSKWRIIDIANNTFLSASEITESIKRLKLSSILNSERKVIENNFLEFIVYGLKYAFPAKIGMPCIGIPTAHSGKFLKKRINTQKSDLYVWPYQNALTRGVSIEPLYKTLPKIALNDDFMYKYLALIDLIRIGRSREKNIAIKEFEKLFNIRIKK